MSNSSIPDNLKYSKEHEWVRVEDNGIAYVGITDYAQSQLGDLVYVEVETVGDVIKVDDIFGTAEAVKTTSELYMPVAGKVLEFNSQIADTGGDNPGLINEDPYGEGWIIKVEMTNPEDLDRLLDAKAYEAEIG